MLLQLGGSQGERNRRAPYQCSMLDTETITMAFRDRRSTVRTLILLLVTAVPISILATNLDWISQLTYAVEVRQSRVSHDQLATATDLSQAFRHVARSIRPSVVSISSVKHIRARQPSPQRFRHQLPEEFRGFFNDDQLEKFFEYRTPRGSFEQRGLGSGVIISEDGYILTNNHVVGDADEVKVELSDAREFRAEIVGTDASTDLAVLKIEANNLEPARLGDSDQLEVGEWVLAIGSPFGLDQTVTAGIISAKSRANVGITDYEDFIQTDAAINPGNSGGPLVNLHGEVVGINTAIASRSGGYMGIGFAIPSGMAQHVMDGIISDGHVTRGWLGAMIQDLNKDLADSFGFSSTDGVLIGDLVADGPGKKSGLQSGDIITKYNGEPVETANELRNSVARTKPNERAELEVYRDGQSILLTIEVGQLKQDSLRLGSDSDTAVELGMTVQYLTSDDAREMGLQEGTQGVVVTDVREGSLAARAMIRPKDVIVSIGRMNIKSVAEFREAMSSQDPRAGIRLQVLRNGFGRFVFIRGN